MHTIKPLVSRQTPKGRLSWKGPVRAASVCELVRGRPAKSRDDHGATATEYALMVSLIALVIVAAITLFGQNVITLFDVPSSIFSQP